MDIGTLVAGLLTLAVLSFLYRDNPVYKMAESLLIGVSIGYFLVVTWESTLMDTMFEPLFAGDNFWLLLPLLLGLLMFARFGRRVAWLAKIPIGFLIGSGAGVAIPAMLYARTIKQMSATVVPLTTSSGWPDISGIVVLVGVTTTITYFYFSREHEGALGRSAKIGTYFLMVFFGATFGFTVMSRMSTFIGRMEFLLTDFLGFMY